ncbi:hypothetical protein cgR_6034 [Corynebacterium glutamicum R]|uniref:Uncharacterized protein n=1 Tax=Corynebacterium glutamicum (strain R) TaxID=340322 RepID=A0AB72VFL2_CORGB|nr:hypothetical protein cgR_6034 [Corynebacterium glutamicum R]
MLLWWIHLLFRARGNGLERFGRYSFIATFGDRVWIHSFGESSEMDKKLFV